MIKLQLNGCGEKVVAPSRKRPNTSEEYCFALLSELLTQTKSALQKAKVGFIRSLCCAVEFFAAVYELAITRLVCMF